MVATLGGLLALPLGLVVLLLPLLAHELSRPRDSAWGALVLLLGLVLVTSADRLSGAPMLGVICAGLLIGRLGVEVGLGRWRQLSEEERSRLGSLERWRTSFSQLAATLAGASGELSGRLSSLAQNLAQRRGADGQGLPAAAAGRSRRKRWVRPEAAPATPAAAQEPAADQSVAPTAQGEAVAEPAGDEAAAAPAAELQPPAAEAPAAADA